MLERLREEIKRRTLVVRIFPNAAALFAPGAESGHCNRRELDRSHAVSQQEQLAEQKKKLFETSATRLKAQPT